MSVRKSLTSWQITSNIKSSLVSSHKGIISNKKADTLARTPKRGSEPVVVCQKP